MSVEDGITNNVDFRMNTLNKEKLIIEKYNEYVENTFANHDEPNLTLEMFVKN